MGDRRALQAGTSHNLGDNFAKVGGRGAGRGTRVRSVRSVRGGAYGMRLHACINTTTHAAPPPPPLCSRSAPNSWTSLALTPHERRTRCTAPAGV